MFRRPCWLDLLCLFDHAKRHLSHFILFNRTWPTLKPLQIGTHDYFNTTIEVTPVNTLVHGMCYRFKMPHSIPSQQGSQRLFISSSTSGVDKLKNVLFYIASENTWQRVIINNWPYSNTQLKLGLKFLLIWMKIYGNIVKECLILMNVWMTSQWKNVYQSLIQDPIGKFLNWFHHITLYVPTKDSQSYIKIILCQVQSKYQENGGSDTHLSATKAIQAILCSKDYKRWVCNWWDRICDWQWFHEHSYEIQIGFKQN